MNHTTSTDSAPPRPTASLRDAWHQQTEWEVAVAYDLGYQQGVADARAAMTAALDEALAGPTCYNLTPAPKGAQDVVQRMVRTMDRAARVLTPQAATGDPGGSAAANQPTAGLEAAA